MQPFLPPSSGAFVPAGLVGAGSAWGSLAGQPLPRGNGRRLLAIDPALERLVAPRSIAAPEAGFAPGADAARIAQGRGNAATGQVAATTATTGATSTAATTGATGATTAAATTTAAAAQGREFDLLDRELALARHWLEQPDAPARLAERRLALPDVLAELSRIEAGVRAQLARWNREGEVTFTRVPSAHDLFCTAVRATRPLPADGTDPVPAIGGPGAAAVTAGTTLAATPAGAAAAQTPTAASAADGAAAATAPAGGLDPARRAQALAFLREFEADAGQRVVQLRRGGLELFSLLGGKVRFFHESDLVRAMPCAQEVTLNRSYTWAGSRFAPVRTVQSHWQARYRPAAPGGRALTEASHGRWPVLVARIADGERLGDVHEVSISRDQRSWLATGVYTDDEVEAQKQQMWQRILQRAEGRLPPMNSWGRWMRW